jgi:selenocysteine-specific elongation factor
LIVATAGHVDHGKTSLIRALTGVETDTLAEEIKRGLSINLGYAYLPDTATPGALGFIDVPGHRRFINTMISGISGIDMGLLVVAADDGPMPQTLEHIDVLNILGIQQLVVAISKIDRVDPQRINEVTLELSDILDARGSPKREFMPLSSTSGQGVAELKKNLLRAAKTQKQQLATGGFRLSIDRSFNVNGVGLVVTGTASAGTVNKGAHLQLLPGAQTVRVRHLRANHQDVHQAVVGQRVALGISGKVSLKHIQRGDWLVAPDGLETSARLDVSVSLSNDAPFALKHMTPVKLYIGAKRVSARLALIEHTPSALTPGSARLAQLILAAPISAVWGERFLLQDHAEETVLGGGTILDPAGPQYGKSRVGRLEWLRALQQPEALTALEQLLQTPRAINLTHFWMIRNRQGVPPSAVLPNGAKVFERDSASWIVTENHWSSICEWLEQHIHQYHQQQPQASGIKMSVLKKNLGANHDLTTGMAVLESLLRLGRLTLKDGHISRKDFEKATPHQSLEDLARLIACLKQSGVVLPQLAELLDQTQIPAQAAKQALRIGVGRRDLHHLNDHRYALPEQLHYYYESLKSAHGDGEALSVINLKKRFKTGRNLTIEILEYFDQLRLTRRAGNVRELLTHDNVSRTLGIGP